MQSGRIIPAIWVDGCVFRLFHCGIVFEPELIRNFKFIEKYVDLPGVWAMGVGVDFDWECHFDS